MTFILIWLDVYDCPDIWITAVPVFSMVTQGLVIYSYQFVDWKILREIPYNMLFFVCMRSITLLVFIPGIRPPLLIMLMVHWFMIVEYYSYNTTDLVARGRAGDDL